MNRLASLVALVSFYLGSIGATTAREAPAPTLAGSLYKLAAFAKDSVPVVGATVYLHPVTSTNPNEWIGPSLTDVYGRFTFTGVPGGQYLLRMYSGHIHLWEQLIELPAKLQPIVIRDVRVVYYPKAAGGTKVSTVLQHLPFPYDELSSDNKIATNIIWFGKGVAIEDIKTIADALLKAGVQLRAIRRFQVGTDLKAKLVEVGASPSHTTGAILSVDWINAQQDFPVAT